MYTTLKAYEGPGNISILRMKKGRREWELNESEFRRFDTRFEEAESLTVSGEWDLTEEEFYEFEAMFEECELMVYKGGEK